MRSGATKTTMVRHKEAGAPEIFHAGWLQVGDDRTVEAVQQQSVMGRMGSGMAHYGGRGGWNIGNGRVLGTW